MIRESIARLCTLRMGVNTIHSLISLKNFADALRGASQKIFSNKGMVENVENRGQLFLMMTR